MRTVLRLIGTRYGIAMVLIVLVLVVVGTGRLLAGSRTPDAVGPVVGAPTTPAQSDFDPGDDSAEEPGDGGPAPSLSVAVPAVSTTASRFIAAWLKHTGLTADQWREGLAPNATATLMTKLQNTDPSSVPADVVTGDITATDEGGSVWSASVPVNGGTVTLRIVAIRGRWQVDGIDWSPA